MLKKFFVFKNPALPLQEAKARSLVGELKTHKPHGVAKKIKSNQMMEHLWKKVIKAGHAWTNGDVFHEPRIISRLCTSVYQASNKKEKPMLNAS